MNRLAKRTGKKKAGCRRKWPGSDGRGLVLPPFRVGHTLSLSAVQEVREQLSGCLPFEATHTKCRRDGPRWLGGRLASQEGAIPQLLSAWRLWAGGNQGGMRLDALGALAVLAVAAGGADDEHGAALAAAGLVGRHGDGVYEGGVVVVVVVVAVVLVGKSETDRRR